MLSRSLSYSPAGRDSTACRSRCSHVNSTGEPTGSRSRIRTRRVVINSHAPPPRGPSWNGWHGGIRTPKTELTAQYDSISSHANGVSCFQSGHNPQSPVRVEGFEPPTTWPPAKRATKLRHTLLVEYRRIERRRLTVPNGAPSHWASTRWSGIGESNPIFVLPKHVCNRYT